MGKLILSIFALSFFISFSSAAELQGGYPENPNCPAGGKEAGGRKYSPPGDHGRNGFSVFSIEAPARNGNETRNSGSIHDDKEFMDSLRMFLGVGGAGPPECLRPPNDRGVLKNEQ